MANGAAAQGNRTVPVGQMGGDRFHAHTSCSQVIPHRHLTIRRDAVRELGAPVVVRDGDGAAADPIGSGLPSGAA